MKSETTDRCAAQVVRTEKKLLPGQAKRRSEIGRCAARPVRGSDLCGLHQTMANRGYMVDRWKVIQKSQMPEIDDALDEIRGK